MLRVCGESVGGLRRSHGLFCSGLGFLLGARGYDVCSSGGVMGYNFHDERIKLNTEEFQR